MAALIAQVGSSNVWTRDRYRSRGRNGRRDRNRLVLHPSRHSPATTTYDGGSRWRRLTHARGQLASLSTGRLAIPRGGNILDEFSLFGGVGVVPQQPHQHREHRNAPWHEPGGICAGRVGGSPSTSGSTQLCDWMGRLRINFATHRKSNSDRSSAPRNLESTLLGDFVCIVQLSDSLVVRCAITVCLK